jgi:hypothetical protein
LPRRHEPDGSAKAHAVDDFANEVFHVFVIPDPENRLRRVNTSRLQRYSG